MLKKPKQVKKPSLKSLKKKLDHAFEMYVRYRDKWTCFTCGIIIENKTDMHGGHLISRKHHSTRWDEDNCKAQCAGCNYKHVWQPHVYTDLYIQKYGPDKYHELVTKSKQTFKVNRGSLEELLTIYESKLNEAINRN